MKFLKQTGETALFQDYENRIMSSKDEVEKHFLLVFLHFMFVICDSRNENRVN